MTLTFWSREMTKLMAAMVGMTSMAGTTSVMDMTALTRFTVATEMMLFWATTVRSYVSGPI